MRLGVVRNQIYAHENRNGAGHGCPVRVGLTCHATDCAGCDEMRLFRSRASWVQIRKELSE